MEGRRTHSKNGSFNEGKIGQVLRDEDIFYQANHDLNSFRNSIYKEFLKTKGLKAYDRVEVVKADKEEFTYLKDKINKLEAKIDSVKKSLDGVNPKGKGQLRPRESFDKTKSELIAKYTLNNSYDNIMTRRIEKINPISHIDLDKTARKYRPTSTSASANQSRNQSRTPEKPKSKKQYYMEDVEESLRKPTDEYFNKLYREHIADSYRLLKSIETTKAVYGYRYPRRNLVLHKKEIYKGKKTLILDLDETLIHSLGQNEHGKVDKTLKIMMPNRDYANIGIKKRPYCTEFLKEMSNYYEIMVFTASHEYYANAVMDYIDPKKEYIQHRLTRKHCETLGMNLVKDLRILNRDLKDVILVDNLASSYAVNLENGIPIIPFTTNSDDQELMKLAEFLKKIHKSGDVRSSIDGYFQTKSFKKFNTFQQLCQHLFN